MILLKVLIAAAVVFAVLVAWLKVQSVARAHNLPSANDTKCDTKAGCQACGAVVNPEHCSEQQQ